MGDEVEEVEDIPMKVQIQNPYYKDASSIFDFMAKDIHGEAIQLDKYKGKACLIVNVARKCGMAETNYKQLKDLHNMYSDKGFSILAFPSNQFNQEPGTSEDVLKFIQEQKVEFDVFEKVHINGDDAHPLWKFLKYKQGGVLGDFIKWNFTKFMIDKEGHPVERHGPNVDPIELVSHIEKYLPEEATEAEPNEGDE